jgi:O-antigen ligase
MMIVMVLLAFVLPLAMVPGLYEFAMIPKAVVVCVASLFAMLVFHTTVSRRYRVGDSHAPIKGTGIILAILVFMIFVNISCIGATDKSAALSDALFQCSLVAIFLSLSQCARMKHWFVAFLVMLSTAAAVAVVGILQYHGKAFMELPFSSLYPAVTFSNRNLVSEYLICVLPIGIALILGTRSVLSTAVYGTMSGAIFACIVYTRTRGAWVGLVVGSCVGLYAFMSSRLARDNARLLLKRMSTWKAVTVCIISAATAYVAQLEPSGDFLGENKETIASTIKSLIPSVTIQKPIVEAKKPEAPVVEAKKPEAPVTVSRETPSVTVSPATQDIKTWDGSATTRFVLWEGTSRMIKDNFVLGVGAGNWIAAYPPYDRGVTVTTYGYERRPHSDWLLIASEYGVPALVAFVCFLMLGVRTMLSRASSHPKFSLWNIAGAVSVTAITVAGFFEFPRSNPATAIFPFFWIAFVVSGMRPSGRACLWAVLACSVAITFATSLSVIVHLGKMKSDDLYREAFWKASAAFPAIDTYETAASAGAFIGADADCEWIRAVVAYKLGEMDTALLHAENIIAARPYSWYAHNVAGMCQLRAGEELKARQHFQIAATICPTNRAIKNSIGATYAVVGDLKRATEWFTQALPDEDAQRNLAIIRNAPKGGR